MLLQALRWFGRQQGIDRAQPFGIALAQHDLSLEGLPPLHKRTRISSADVPVAVIDECDALWRPVIVGNSTHPSTPAAFQ